MVPSRRSGVHLHLGVLIGAATAGVLWWTGRPASAALLVVAILALMQARVVIRGLAAAMDRAMEGLGRLIGRGLASLLLGLVFVAVVVPVWVVASPFRRRPMGVPRKVDGWTGRAVDSRAVPARRTFGPDPHGAPLQVRRTATRVALVVLAFAVVDLVAGAALSVTRVLPGDRGVLLAKEEVAWAQMMDAPTVRDEPWSQQYLEDGLGLIAQPQQYIPYLVWGFRPYSSRYINITDRERRSYEPDLAPGTRPLRIAFLGGSVMFGQGQRDAHTIPSEFARVAERAGVPVEVHNYGMYGWVSWQEYQYLERLLASGERYDLVVIYDGENDYMAQLSNYSQDPTDGAAQILAEFGAQAHEKEYTYAGFLDGFRDLAATYRSNSGVARVVDHVMHTDDDRQPWRAETSAVTPEDAIHTTFDIYERSQAAVGDLAARYDTPVRYFWQPQKLGWPESVRSRIPSGTRDLTDVFAGVSPSPYIDYVHTDERGARIVAERLWREVGGELSRAARPPS